MATASGGGVPTSVKVWAAAGLSLIAFWPADAAGNTSILVDGVAQTPVLVNGGDYIDLGDEELGVLLGFALHLLAFKAPDQVFQSTQPLQKAFYQAAAAKNVRFGTSDFLRHFLGLDKPRSPFQAKHPVGAT